MGLAMLSDLPEYTIDGLIGVSIVNAEWANAIFYCEDSGYEAVYERLLKKLCPELTKFMVACTGGKTITQKLAERSSDIPIPHFMLVDKDYDDLNGFLEKRQKLGIAYLRRYSIENYLTQIEALVEVALEELSKDNRSSTKLALEDKIQDCKEYISSLTSCLEKIGRHFVFCQKHRINIRTCKTAGSEIFADATDQSPSPESWFENFKSTLIEDIAANSDWMLEEGWIDAQLSTAFDPKCEPWGRLEPAAHIVGKHLLFGLLTYLDARLGTSFREMGSRELCLRLLSHASINDLEYLRTEIHAKLGKTPALSAAA